MYKETNKFAGRPTMPSKPKDTSKKKTPITAGFYMDRKGFCCRDGKTMGFYCKMYYNGNEPERILLMVDDPAVFSKICPTYTLTGSATYWRTNTNDEGVETKVYWAQKLFFVEDEDYQHCLFEDYKNE